MKKLDIAIKLFGALLILVTAFPGTAAADPTIAEVENLGDTLVFHPVTEFARLVLTVTGPCDFRFQQVVTKGTPFFRLDETTIDGRYRYNLVRQEEIDPGIVEILQDARKNLDEETPKQLCRDGKLPAAPIVQTAGFGVDRGKIVYDPGSFEKVGGDTDLSVDEVAALASVAGMSKKPVAPGSRLTTKDFVILDDLIVDGSACIGFDCVNGEVFGFDTIRLKENNLRIKFDDTSVAASFPSNDWQLTANDSANGGASKFSIEDISGSRTPFTVEANARSHSLYVDDGGRIGSRTSTPSTEIHTIDGDTPTLRLQQDGSSGFAPQTWDVAGNETNFFIRDVTNGSQLPFRIRPDAPTSAIDVASSGDIGIGTASPDHDVNVERGNEAISLGLTSTQTNQGWILNYRADTAGENFLFNYTGIAGNEFTFTTGGDLTITGDLVTGGAGACNPGPCDGVFSPEYQVESIEEHAAYMWENSHLWGVGPTPEGSQINLTKKTTGILHELEKAHIYIEQLHNAMGDQKERLASQQELIQQLSSRLSALEQGN